MISVAEGVTVTREELVRAFAAKKAHVSSIHPVAATPCLLLRDVRAELEAGRRETAEDVTKPHPRAAATLQGLVRLRELAGVLRDAKDGAARIAGDAAATILLELVEAHIELVEQRGFELPELTTGPIRETRTWLGAEIAAATRQSRADLLPFYGEVLRDVRKRAGTLAEAATDREIAAQYRELSAWVETAIEALRIRTVAS